MWQPWCTTGALVLVLNACGGAHETSTGGTGASNGAGGAASGGQGGTGQGGTGQGGTGQGGTGQGGTGQGGTRQEPACSSPKISFASSDGAQWQAHCAHPTPGEPAPAVIYMHGGRVEVEGEAAAKDDWGYDLAAFPPAFAAAGYIGFAPVRPLMEQGAEPTCGAIEYLRRSNDVDIGRIYLMGFSKGGPHVLQGAVACADKHGAGTIAGTLFTSTFSQMNFDKIPFAQIDWPMFASCVTDDLDGICDTLSPGLVEAWTNAGLEATFFGPWEGDHHSNYDAFDQVLWPEIVSWLDSH